MTCRASSRPLVDPTVSVGNVHTLTAVGDSDSFLFLSPSFLSLHILPRSPCPLHFIHWLESFGKLPLPPLAIWVFVYLWWVNKGTWGYITMDKWSRGPKKNLSYMISLYWVHCSLPVVWYVLPVQSWFLFNALLMQQHSPAPLYQCVALLLLFLTV